MNRLHDLIGSIVRGMGMLVGVLSLLGGVAIVGWQLYQYLQAGSWSPMGAISTLGWFLGWNWAAFPTTWIGMHQILDAWNAGFALALVGGAIGGAMWAVE